MTSTPEQLQVWRDIGHQKWMDDDSVVHDSKQKDCYIAGYLRAKQETKQAIKDARKQTLEEVLAICNGALSFPDSKYYISDKVKEILK